MYYAPFDYVETRAKVALVGIAPGASQAATALAALRKTLLQGLSDDEALRRAKATASFSGRMRANLVAMLDSIGLQRKLDVGSYSEVFAEDSDSVHFISALRYPVFLKNRKLLRQPFDIQITAIGICLQPVASGRGTSTAEGAVDRTRSKPRRAPHAIGSIRNPRCPPGIG